MDDELARLTEEGDDLVVRLLGAARNRLGMELAWMSSFDDGRQVLEVLEGEADGFGLRAGWSSALEGSFCARVLDGRLPNAVTDALHHPETADLPVTRDLNIGSYIGVPITDDDGAPAGMVCCISRGASPDLDDHDVAMLRLLAELIGELAGPEETEPRRRRRIRDRILRIIANASIRIRYQPIVDSRSGAIVGFEALSRFPVAPRRPDVWFSEATETGLGAELGIAAIRSALEGLAHLPADTHLSLNASPETILDGRLATELAPHDPSRLVVELTEHDVVEDYDALRRELTRLSSAGVRIAVDDAGAGFASFAHVLELQPDIIKVDRSLVRGIDDDPARQALVRGIVQLASSLGAVTVAEGVETAAELATSRALGLDRVQGYLLGRPAPLPDCLTLRCDPGLLSGDGAVGVEG